MVLVRPVKAYHYKGNDFFLNTNAKLILAHTIQKNNNDHWVVVFNFRKYLLGMICQIKKNNMNIYMHMYKITFDTLVAYIVCSHRIGRIYGEFNFKGYIRNIARRSYIMVYNLMMQIFNPYVLFSQPK